MHQSMVLSVIVSRKSGSSGVSIGDGHTLLMRMPCSCVAFADSIV